jgi:hypothetical protein
VSQDKLESRPLAIEALRMWLSLSLREEERTSTSPASQPVSVPGLISIDTECGFHLFDLVCLWLKKRSSVR